MLAIALLAMVLVVLVLVVLVLVVSVVLVVVVAVVGDGIVGDEGGGGGGVGPGPRRRCLVARPPVVILQPPVAVDHLDPLRAPPPHHAALHPLLSCTMMSTWHKLA